MTLELVAELAIVVVPRFSAPATYVIWVVFAQTLKDVLCTSKNQSSIIIYSALFCS